ncbi:uncharacterized protein Dwil_GK19193, partial [Drosophila willistoni]
MSFLTDILRRRKKGDDHFVFLLTVTLVVLLSVFGLFPITYSPRSRERFQFSIKHLIYCMLVTILFASVYVRQMYQDYIHNQLNLQDATKLYSYMNVIVTVVNYITQMVMGRQVARMMRRVPLFSTLRVFKIDRKIIWRSVGTSLIKVIAFPLILEITLVIQQRHYEPELNWMWSLYKLYPMIISNLLNNCYYGAMIIVKAILQALNARLKNQLKEVNYMQREDQIKLTTPYYRMQKFCSLADEMDIMAEQYMIVYTHSNNYLKPQALSMILSLICHLLGMTVGFFMQYYNLADTFISGKVYDGFGALINLVFLGISLAEIVMLAHLCNDILEETSKTGRILQNIDYLHADCRYKQAIFTFSLMILNMKFRIKPLGLFELDMSLIMNVFSSMSGFLIILVQGDLWQRA